MSIWRALVFISLTICQAYSQLDTTYPTIDLRLGEVGAPSPLLVSVGGMTSVVFERLPHTASCPSGRGGDFALKKVNPKSGHPATFEHISSICTIIDSISINTETIYEVYTARQEIYYMQLMERIGGKVKVRLTTDLPTTIQNAGANPKGTSRLELFDANGARHVPGEGAKSIKLFGK